MDRRELLKLIALATGGVVIGGDLFLSGCTNGPSIGGPTFNTDDIAFLDEVGETILPKTKTPGAKEAGIGKFMETMVNDTYDKNNQKIFHEGINKLNEACEKKFDTSFMKATAQQRTELLVELDKEAKAYQKEKSEFDREQNKKEAAEKEKGNNDYKKETKPTHYFTLMKQLSLLGFFTSKPGATMALRHEAVPGKYDGNLPYKRGDRAWAE
jgi:hypothetical protein